MKIRPLADRVLVKTEKSETKTASGIIIPETAQEKTVCRLRIQKRRVCDRPGYCVRRPGKAHA